MSFPAPCAWGSTGAAWTTAAILALAHPGYDCSCHRGQLGAIQKAVGVSIGLGHALLSAVVHLRHFLLRKLAVAIGVTLEITIDKLAGREITAPFPLAATTTTTRSATTALAGSTRCATGPGAATHGGRQP